MKARKSSPLLAFWRLTVLSARRLHLVQFLNTFAVLPGVWGAGAAWAAGSAVLSVHRTGNRRQQPLRRVNQWKPRRQLGRACTALVRSRYAVGTQQKPSGRHRLRGRFKRQSCLLISKSVER